MEKLLDKSISQTDEVVKIACQAIAGTDRLREKVIELEAERDRLREINKELVEALKTAERCLPIFLSQKILPLIARAEKTT